jgi:hypothetical protein
MNNTTLTPDRARTYMTLLGYTSDTLTDAQIGMLYEQVRLAARQRARQQHWSAQELIDIWEHRNLGEGSSDLRQVGGDEEARSEAGWWLRRCGHHALSAFQRQFASIRMRNGSYGVFLDRVKELIEGALR